MVTRPVALALLALAACGSDHADDRFAQGQSPVVAPLAEGVTLSAFPGRVRREGAAVVFRSASPDPVLDLTAAEPADARVLLDNLAPATRFEPAPRALEIVGPTRLAATWRLPAGTTRVRARAGGDGPARFAVVSDIHNNLEVYGRFSREVKAWRPDAVIGIGDLTDRGKPEEMEEMLAHLPDPGVPFYTTIGNHDLMGEAWRRFEEVVGPTSVAFEVRGVRVVLVDSANATVAPASYPWLAEKLSGRPGGPALVFAHIPPLEPWGSRNHAFATREDGLRFVQALADGNATQFFAGHIHALDQWTMGGIPAVITGGGGGQVESTAAEGHHFLKLVVDPLAARPVAFDVVRLDP